MFAIADQGLALAGKHSSLDNAAGSLPILNSLPSPGLIYDVITGADAGTPARKPVRRSGDWRACRRGLTLLFCMDEQDAQDKDGTRLFRSYPVNPVHPCLNSSFRRSTVISVANYPYELQCKWVEDNKPVADKFFAELKEKTRR